VYALLLQRSLPLVSFGAGCTAVVQSFAAASSPALQRYSELTDAPATHIVLCVLAGIGPKDDEFSNKKFSFVRYQSICAVIPDSSDFEAKARAAGDEALAIERGGMKQQ
jgi:hypothetical protein